MGKEFLDFVLCFNPITSFSVVLAKYLYPSKVDISTGKGQWLMRHKFDTLYQIARMYDGLIMSHHICHNIYGQTAKVWCLFGLEKIGRSEA
jgi:hypothetical protein